VVNRWDKGAPLDMDPCWKELPIELVERICNMLTKVRRFNQGVLDDIKNQTHMFDRYYWTVLGLFGFENVWYAMYGDLQFIARIPDAHPHDMRLEDVVFEMWKSASREQREEIVVHY
jgi:hypothetical protein